MSQRSLVVDTTSVLTPPAAAAPASRRVRLAERLVMGALAGMPRGRLHVETPDGARHRFGANDDESPAIVLPPGIASEAHVRILDTRFFDRCLLHGDIGFAESHLAGEWESPDLAAVVAWFLLNVEDTPTLSGSRKARTWMFNILRLVDRFGHLLRPNSRSIARRNISAHYDLSNDFFSLFLDPSMMYSSARYTRPEATLEEAQFEKNDALCRSLRLEPQDHVLEIGTGWGGWALHAASRYGCRVTTLTISREQAALARSRIEAAGLGHLVEVRLQDFRDEHGSYDKLVSIEMMEALGHRYQPAFAAALARVLKPHGLAALQFITCPDSRYEEFRTGVDFIQKHVFPGSLLLSLNRVNSLLAASGGFLLHECTDMGADYARTLREWRATFETRLERVRALGFDDIFVRKWRYYLCYCEAAFAMRNISVVQTLYTRPNNLALAR
ncbi:cyclopropane-fatty-acyl-phospholipid synthase family protein [Opitutales bacterium ASA1]|uniref:class I SAM-dependent methyltransferase n=1 Tax=Congregicoccus parvus TaxID=3081749 RepID=UPI002B2A857A|nr:cyclopropane-fatty-acyl-phospholipid synthase family protein [Opitutales bacterium ASA1]